MNDDVRLLLLTLVLLVMGVGSLLAIDILRKRQQRRWLRGHLALVAATLLLIALGVGGYLAIGSLAAAPAPTVWREDPLPADQCQCRAMPESPPQIRTAAVAD